MLRWMFTLILAGLVLIACNPTTGGGNPAVPTITPTPDPNTISISFGGSLSDTPVMGPAGNVCLGELQDQTVTGTISTILEFVRAQHTRIDVTGGTYITSFQAAVGCGPDGTPNTFGPVAGPTTVTFSFTYVGAYDETFNPLCIGRSLLIINSFNTTAGPTLDAEAETAFRDSQHRDMDRRLAVAMNDYYNGGSPPVTTPRCSNWVPLSPAVVGL